MSVVATLSGVLRLDDSDFRSGMRGAKDEMKSFGDRMRDVGDNVRDFGTRMTVATAPVAAYLTNAVMQTQTFNRSMSNVNAILGITGDEAAALRQEILAYGMNTVAGAQATADAYYAIVSGVQDASTHMAILDAATKTSEAGQADLMSTTSALITTMNAYGFAADDASHVSDIFTRTVQTGVLTMDDLAASFPTVVGLAARFGVSAEEAAASLAFLTTKNSDAALSSTYLRAMMTTLLNPTGDLETAIKALGYESGAALLEAEGLAGSYQLLSDQNGGLDGLITNTEALQGALGLTDASAAQFFDTYMSGVDGATERAGLIQGETEQWDRLKSQMSGLAIQIGSALMPILLDLVTNYISPAITAISSWISENPQLTQTIVGLVGALIVAGPIITAIGIAIGFLASPIGLLTALVGGAIAYFGDFGAIMSALQGIFMRFQVSGLTDGFTLLFTTFEDGSSHISDLLQAFGLSEEMSNNVANTINQVLVPALVGIWTNAQESLGALFSWFMETGLPAIQGFITDTVIPGVQSFIDTLVRIWNDVSPTLTLLFDWFMTTGLPMMVDYVNVTFVPAIESIVNIMTGIWDAVSPYLGQLYDWFVTTGLPAIGDYITGPFTTAFQGLIDFIGSIWEVVQPGLQAFQDGIGGVFTWIMDNAIGPVSGALATAGSWINGATTWTGNALSTAGDFISNNNPFAPTQLGGTGQGRAAGGEVNPNSAYMVGETGPEVFVPSVPGEIMNQDQMNGMGGGINIQNVHINANSYEGGRAAGRGFMDEINELSRGRGIRAAGT